MHEYVFGTVAVLFAISGVSFLAVVLPRHVLFRSPRSAGGQVDSSTPVTRIEWFLCLLAAGAFAAGIGLVFLGIYLRDS